MTKYKNVISLGFFCSTALEMERIGLREFSGPFDWVISDFDKVLELIKNKFEGFLDEKYLYQKKVNPSHYVNIKYNIRFFHDFDKYKSLKDQICSVKKKYSRRIERFYKRICEPTLFIRYIYDENECKFIEQNSSEICTFLKSFNKDNEIIFIANNSIKSDKINIYNVEPDIDDSVARRFLEKNNELSVFLNSNIYDKDVRQSNLERYNKKNIDNKSISIIKRILCRVCKIFMKPYIHDRLI